ncbi:MAG: hypothetical protein PUB32_04585 [Clostridiales bacterium]|nr:hypothetical protein [Clostridiales bacterium]
MDKDSKIIAELEKLYSGVEGWDEKERRDHIITAYHYIKKQQEAQAKYGTVDANDPEAVRAAVERRKAEGGGEASASAGNNAVVREYDAAAKNVERAVDASTGAAVAGVKAAKAEAEARYQSQRDAAAAQAARDMDNSALYSELRGDYGGIGKAQYDSIQNTAAKNQAEINRAQTEMARAAAVEIAGLQAKGEYEKAEKLLNLAQKKLAALMELDQWQAEYAADERELQAKLSQWQAEYELSAAKLMGGTASGQPTADTRARLAALGEAMLKKGLMPNAAQLDAMGMTNLQAREYIRSLNEG